MKEYKCKECGNRVCKNTVVYGKGRCRKCMYKDGWSPNKGKKFSDSHKHNISISKLGESNPSWNNGYKKDKLGYILVYSPKHPYHSKRYVREHRLVMEKYLGRYLEPTEIVHHVNKVVDDNRLENLRLFENNGEHIAFHRWEGK